MIINICGIEHEIIEEEDFFDSEATHLGRIEYATAKIYINKELTDDLKTNTIAHEVVHGILTHIGREDLSNDETLVTTLAGAILRSFDMKVIA